MTAAAPGDGGGILNQGFTIAGHKISWAAVGALAAAVGVFAVMRAKASSSNVVSAGSAPATTSYAVPTLDTGLTGTVSPDYTASIENLSQQVSSLQQQVQASQQAPATPAAPTVNINPPANFANTIALLSQPANMGWQNYEVGVVDRGTQLESAGAPVQGPVFSYAGVTSEMWQPVVGPGGGKAYVWSPNVQG